MTGAAAQDVTITSRTGNLQLTGPVAGFDGTYLEVGSPYGPVVVNMATVTCAGDACPSTENFVPLLRLSGEPDLATLLLPALLEGYALDWGLTLMAAGNADGHVDATLTDGAGADVLRLSLMPTTSAAALTDLVDYRTDVALTLREPSVAERDRAAQAGHSLTGTGDGIILLGTDALVPVVSPRNPQRSIVTSDLIAALSGQTTDWTALGQPGLPLTLHLGPPDGGMTEALFDALGVAPPTGVVHHATPADLAAAVADDPGALGVTTLAEVGVAQAVTLFDTCGLTATPRAVDLATQDYPLTVPAFAVVRSRVQPDAVIDLLSWLRGPGAAAIVRRSGLTDRTMSTISLNEQGQRIAHAVELAGTDITLGDLQAMIAQMRARSRIPLTFRFGDGDLGLDAASASNLRRLALDIRDGTHAGRDILLAGFTDGAGEAQANRDLSAARALAVEAALLDHLGALPADVALVTAGYGEAMPVACDDTGVGRALNRRVEVWIGD